MPKGRSLWTPSLHWKPSTLLHALILSLFPVAWLNGLGFQRGHKEPSFYRVFIEANFVYLHVGGKYIFQDSERIKFSKTCQLVHQWGQEEWLHRHEDMSFKGYVHVSISSEKWLVLSKTFGSEHCLLGGSHRWWVIDWVVQWHRYVSRLCHELLCCHCQSEVSV